MQCNAMVGHGMAWYVCMYIILYYITVDYHQMSKDLPSFFLDPDNYRINIYIYVCIWNTLDFFR